MHRSREAYFLPVQIQYKTSPHITSFYRLTETLLELWMKSRGSVRPSETLCHLFSEHN